MTDVAENLSEREKEVRRRLASDFKHYAPRALAILPKPDEASGARKLVKFEFNRAQEYIHKRLEEQRERLGYVRAIILKGRQQGACVTPETRVLLADMTWRAIDDLHPGDEVVALDEFSRGKTASGRNETRKMRTAIVEAKAEFVKDVVAIELSNGTTLRCTLDHRWLTRKRGGDDALWREAGDLRVGDVLRAAAYQPDDVPLTHEDGWVGGILDADGSCSVTKLARVAFNQIEGGILDRYKDYLRKHGIGFYENVDARKQVGRTTKLGNNPVFCVRVDRFADIVRLMGRARPIRFATAHIYEGRKLPISSSGFEAWPRILSITPIGKRRVVDIQTSEKTFIAEGIVSHNSTYVGGRFYHKTTNNLGQRTFILTHQEQATQNLFAMTARFHENCPNAIRPTTGKNNAKELTFPGLDSQYQVATAGSKGVGRSATLTNVHGSEVAFWENGEEHLAGLFQAVPLARGTEIILESTAKGVGNIFHEEWKKAETGESDFIAIFVPWYWQDEYRREVPDGFELSDDDADAPEGELTEAEYARTYHCTPSQMYWRRRKIIELGSGDDGYWRFKEEYPATPEEAFQSEGVHQSFLSRRAVIKARKSTVATAGSLIIGVDPAGDGPNSDRFVIIRRMTRRLFGPQRLRKLNTMQAARVIHRIIKQEKPVKVFIDVGGLGKGVVDALAELDGTQGIVEPVNFGSAAYDSENYVNRKAEMAWEFKAWLDDEGGANIPDDDEIQGDLLSSQADEPDRNQRRQLKSKRWMRSKGLKSPDYFDAACLTFAAPVSAMGQNRVGNSAVNFDPLALAGGDSYGQGNAGVDFDPMGW